MKPKSKKEAKSVDAYIGTKEFKNKSAKKKKVKRLASKARRVDNVNEGYDAYNEFEYGFNQDDSSEFLGEVGD